MTTALIPRQTLAALVENHDKVTGLVAQAFKLLGEAQKLNTATLGGFSSYLLSERLRRFDLNDAEKSSTKTLEHIKEQHWHYAIKLTGIRNLMSSDDKARMDRMFENHKTPSFDLGNLASTLQGLAENQSEIFSAAISETHKALRLYAANYKTNSTFKVGDKVIINHCVEFSQYGDSVRWYLDDHRKHLLFDLDKVFHFLEGQGFPEYPGNFTTAIEAAMKEKATNCETSYFKAKWFKKGTIHIEFKSPALVKGFNRIAAEGSNELGNEV
ncbi:DUF4942 domain-containing protein [Desulfovibrio ferrophilus]|uniref:DUF4942 domain-containing protein n=1 Tax=Desulfovibrio ferrophilus TaxID=241368 RepID=A0A2Z6B3Q4_9BACT|nr:DUF4942 domain-containing protein [Desulfovibrio ferrophilus]BBD10137.1 uncharacterized protein DFE_A0036 [Desulfovibrio ferrophilus]